MNEDLFRMISAFMEQYKPTPSTTAAALQEKEAKRTDQAGGSQTKIQSSVQELASSDEESLLSSNGM